MVSFARVWNLADAVQWTSAGSWAKPRFEWTFADADGGAMSAWRVRVYADAGKASLLHDSTKQPGVALLYDAPWAGVFNTTYYWTVEVWDDKDEPNTTTPTATAFKMVWGQALYEYNPGSSAAWQFSSASLPTSDVHKALLFRTASGAEAGTPTHSAWVADIGDLVLSGTDWLQVLVRLSTDTSGVQPSLSGMTFLYTGAAAMPDHWLTTGGGWTYDYSNYRFGTRSFRCVVPSNAAEPTCYPYRFVANDDIVVRGATSYVLSCFVRATAALHAGSFLEVVVFAGGSDTVVLAEGGLTVGQIGMTADTRPFPEGWQRLVCVFQTGSGVDRIRPKVRYKNGGAGAGDTFWVDGMKLEVGVVASTWQPGWLSDAAVIDSYGIALDGTGGATLRLKNASGEVDLDDVITAVMGGGGGGGGSDFVTVGTGTLISEIVTVG